MNMTDRLTGLFPFGYNIFNNSVNISLSHFTAVPPRRVKVDFTFSNKCFLSCQSFTAVFTPLTPKEISERLG